MRGCLLGAWALSYGTTTRLLRADGVRAGLCVLCRRALQGQGLGARGPTPRHQSSRRCRYSSYGCQTPTEPSTTGESRFHDRATVPRVRTDAVAATPQTTNNPYDEGLEFPCLMSHWRTWSTFTTFKALMGMTIQGFSVT